MSMSYEENRRLNAWAELEAKEKFKTPEWVKEELSPPLTAADFENITDADYRAGPEVSIVCKYVGQFGPATGMTLEVTVGDLKQEVSLAKGCSWHWYGDV